MKKHIVLFAAVISVFQMVAQDQTVNGKLTVTKQIQWGSTGAIMNTDQGASIELRGSGIPYFDFSNDPTIDYDVRMILRNNNLLSFEGGDIKMSNRLSAGQSISWGNKGAILNTDQGASIELRGNGVPYLDFSNDPTTDFDMRLILRDNNTLGVSGGNMAVDGILKAKQMEVKPNVWADFVFADDYILPSLEKVENHIKQNGHLKDIPSKKQVLENGINIGEMNVKLLQKIEELTLYTIQQQKNIKAQNDQIIKQQKDIEKLKQLYTQLPFNKDDSKE